MNKAQERDWYINNVCVAFTPVGFGEDRPAGDYFIIENRSMSGSYYVGRWVHNHRGRPLLMIAKDTKMLTFGEAKWLQENPPAVDSR